MFHFIESKFLFKAKLLAKRGILCFAVVAISLFGTQEGIAADSMQLDMQQMAKALKGYLGQEGLDALAVGQFTGPPGALASAGPSITKTLKSELEKLDVKISRRAAYGVSGKYIAKFEAESKVLAIRVTCEIIEAATGKTQQSFNINVHGTETTASMLGLSVEIPADKSKRDEHLHNSIDTPDIHLGEKEIKTIPASPYAIEVLVKQSGNYHHRKVELDDGLAFVPIHRHESYAVKLINNSKFEAAVKLTVDGVSVFAFSDHKNYEYYIVPAHGHMIVKGWHITNKVSEEFVVVPKAQSAIAELSVSPASVGTITAIFSAAWTGNNAPPDELKRSGDATGRGPKTETDFKEVSRNIGRPRSAISVRYQK